ncbi:MAG: cytochrome oxidase maturation protein, cbb3-type [Deltaproteobacteria bacterium GWC2_56_8]|nr:MAG: cytochrome oxidase maturation protein, cbb3-type [Deltaproteobacteria bacterium GWB2_55_19]OGP33796.1 MAG: cytochrome oxidase maturation protein, cbb3-type [Deltaproteobacteria bacterium GWC2_56_8]HAO92610.1 cbb3-type cytochrome oxidase assembly protein CcoS [Deltaproteobacteria bacterium]
MEMLYIMIPAVIFLGVVALIFLIWSVKSGQFEDLEGPGHRIFFDDEEK